MNGTSQNIMPVVYISCDYWGKTALDPRRMAQQLSGVAHVFVEKEYSVAMRLRDATDGKNAYSGYVGVYFPGVAGCERFGLNYFKDSKPMMSSAVINSVRGALTNRFDSLEYNWYRIITLQYRKRISDWQELSGGQKRELDDYVATFDAEIQELKQKNDALNRELHEKQVKIDSLQAQLDASKKDGCFYNEGEERELYEGEYNDLLYSIITAAKRRCGEDTRAYALIRSLLNANPLVGECRRILGEIDEVLGSGRKLTKVELTRLETLGFSVGNEGKHYKLIFRGDPRYTFTLAKTPGEYREGKNMVSTISRKLNVEVF